MTSLRFTEYGHRARSLVHVTIYRRLRIGRDDYLDQSEACDIGPYRYLYKNTGPCEQTVETSPVAGECYK